MNARKRRSSNVPFAACLLVLLLSSGVLASSIGIVYCKHVSRGRFAQLEILRNERDELHIEWSKLLLEQSVLAADNRIDKLARGRLQMESPHSENLVLVRP